MKQTLHIFAKDARRFWPEIAVSLAITAAFARIYPNQWLTPGLYAVSGWGGFAGPPGLQLLASTLAVLVPVSWLLLIARVIHGESLVGDRQFWLTRPYEWRQLLAAKVLFLFVFLYLPLVAAQLALLVEAGFQPFSYTLGLLYDLLLITGTLILPLFAMSTITSTFARMAFAVVGVFLGFIGFGVLSAGVARIAVSTPSGGIFLTPILLCICGAVVALQYAMRRLWLSRLLLIGLFLATGVSMMMPADGSAVDRAYAAKAGNQDAPIQIALLEDANHQVTGSPADGDKHVQINIPVQISGVADGSMMMPDNVRVSIDSPNGIHWTSPWQAIYNYHYLPGPQDSSIAFNIERSVFEKVKSAPVQLRLRLALTQTQAGEATRVPLSATDVSIPGFGVCSPERDWPGVTPEITGIACRSAFRQPKLTYVETLWSNLPCAGTKTEPNTGVQRVAWAGDFDDAPAQFGITSVWSVLVSLSNSLRYTGDRNRPEKPRYLCPGTPITFTLYSVVRRLQTEVVIPNFQLPTKVTPEGYVQAAP
jgi:hypothetical protein